MNKKDFFSVRDIENFISISDRYEKNILGCFSERYIESVISKLKRDKTCTTYVPAIFCRIPDRLKTVEMSKYAIDDNFVNIKYVPKNIQNDPDFFEYIYSSFFDNRRYVHMIQKFLLYYMDDDLFYNIRALLDLKGVKQL